MRSKATTLALATALMLALGAGTAHAKNDVQNGFEREIGRILARTFVGAATYGFAHPPRRHARPHRPHRPQTVVVVKPRPRPHVHHRHHYRPPPRHHHHHGCGHRGHRGHDGVWFVWRH